MVQTHFFILLFVKYNQKFWNFKRQPQNCENGNKNDQVGSLGLEEQHSGSVSDNPGSMKGGPRPCPNLRMESGLGRLIPLDNIRQAQQHLQGDIARRPADKQQPREPVFPPPDMKLPSPPAPGYTTKRVGAATGKRNSSQQETSLGIFLHLPQQPGPQNLSCHGLETLFSLLEAQMVCSGEAHSAPSAGTSKDEQEAHIN